MEQINILACEYCGEMDHSVSDCPALADWRQYQDLQDMAAEAAYYQTSEGAVEKPTETACYCQYINGLTEAIETQIAYLDQYPNTELPDRTVDQLWEVVYRITGRARPVQSWTPGAWTRYQAVRG